MTVEAEVIETALNDTNSAVHDAGIDVPLEPAHGLCQNPPVTIEDWPDPEADADDKLYDDDDEPVGGPNCDPEYVEHDLPARFDPIDEPQLADDKIREILQRHLGDLATQQWVNMYDCILSKRDRNMLGMLAACLCMHFSCNTWDDLRQGQKELVMKLGYRVEAERRFDPEVFEDIFDGDNYRTLRQTLLRLDSDYHFFDHPQDLALGILTDEFRIRNHIDNVICVGVIPGPKQCKDLNSFLVPLLEELLALEEGVEMGGFIPGEDAPCNSILHAFLILGFGDIPAVAKMLLIKAHNA
ncbi:hypothetical protein FRC06_006781, partial [Ceratobasidium sp. 370]